MIKFQEALHKKLYTDSSIPKIPNVLKFDNDFYEMIIEKVPRKLKYILQHNFKIDSISKLMNLDSDFSSLIGEPLHNNICFKIVFYFCKKTL